MQAGIAVMSAALVRVEKMATKALGLMGRCHVDTAFPDTDARMMMIAARQRRAQRMDRDSHIQVSRALSRGDRFFSASWRSAPASCSCD